MQVQHIPGLNNNKTICKTSHNFLASFVFEERLKASLFYKYTKQKELSWNYCEESVVALDAVALVHYAPSAVVKS